MAPPHGRSLATRRTAVAAAASSLALLSVPALPPAAFAADTLLPPLNTLSLPQGSRISSMFEGAMRPKIRALPRRRLEKDFAVLLMRSSYAVADE